MAAVSHSARFMSGIAAGAEFVDIRGIGGLDAETKRRLSRQICKWLKDSLGIANDRGCLNFTGVDAGNWGWNGSVFGGSSMDFPKEKGTYILIAAAPQMKRIEVGQLGQFDIVPGFYAYVGSAFGAGGLAARIGHHLESAAAPHWHLDYLMQVAKPVEVWYAVDDRKLEHHWAELLEQAPQFRIPIPRFGSSDYHRSRSSHLFYSKRRPAFAWFRQQLRATFEDVLAERWVLAEPEG